MRSVELVRTHPNQPGLVAVQTRVGDSEASRVYVSQDCGESWQNVTNTDFHIEDMAWMLRDKVPVLLLATDNGLYELTDPQAGRQYRCKCWSIPQNQAMSFYAVTTSVDARGDVSVAVAAQNSGGVYPVEPGGQARTPSARSRAWKDLTCACWRCSIRGRAPGCGRERSPLATTMAKAAIAGNCADDEDPIAGLGNLQRRLESRKLSRADLQRQRRAGGDPSQRRDAASTRRRQNPQWVKRRTSNSGLPLRDQQRALRDD